MQHSRVTSKGQTTIPGKIRKALRIKQVLKLVARLDSQCLANFPWNGCLSLTRYPGMLHRIVPYSLGIPYILIVPYFTSLGKRLLSIARRWPYIQRCGLICDSQSWAVGI